ncbi:glycoside hydrolase family 32 protein [Paenibacillus thermotolerans]|uniref:glycoside hydrolase family 32 protein n=1 Tax=Paenibacillus thermotolerans TaxID=3027807 RepID=UPI0023675891|nr:MULTISPECIES: glycoside hydrolase family 32 protein [unclassified Paenibacillus]
MKHRERIQAANEYISSPQARLKNERYRLAYHVMPPAGWMNDPNGLVYYNGEYHAFYQHYPFRPNHGPMYWGHVRSSDLVHWEHLPVALAPSEPYDLGASGGYGCWSGSAVCDDGGKLVLIYTGHVDGRMPEEAQCLAYSEDGVHFEKYAGNPVVSGPPEEGCFGFRDPKVWKRGDTWFMVVGSGKDGLGRGLLYKSGNLRDWSYAGVAAESDGTRGNMWECPDLFPLGENDEHTLIISPMNMDGAKNYYISGSFDYESGKLDEIYADRLDYGFDFYAPQTFADGRGRRILIAWMNIWGARMPEQEDGWMGALTVPRELTRASDGSVRMQPVEELKALRSVRYALGSQTIGADRITPLPGIRGDVLEIVAVFDLKDADAREFGLRLRCSSDGDQYTEIRYTVAGRKLSVDRERAGHGDGGISEAVVEPSADGALKLHLFLDRSSVELFANDGVRTITNRIYPDPDSLGVQLFSRGGEARLISLDAWELKPIW